MEETPAYGAISEDVRHRIRVWTKCKVCGMDFWMLPKYNKCLSCALTVGSTFRDSKGKEHIKLGKDDPYYDMAISLGFMGDGWTSKSRYVMAQHLGRCLDPWEYVIHKDRDKDNYEIPNLVLRKRKPRHGDAWEGDDEVIAPVNKADARKLAIQQRIQEIIKRSRGEI